MNTTLKLKWQKFADHTWVAKLGDVTIAMIGERLDGSCFYQVDGIRTKWITKGYGDVGSIAQAKLSVERAWRDWCKKAGFI